MENIHEREDQRLSIHSESCDSLYSISSIFGVGV